MTVAPDVIAFRRRVVRVGGPPLAVGLLLLAVVLELTDSRIIWIDVALLVTHATVHAAAAATVGRAWEPGGRVNFAYVLAIILPISGSFYYADTPQSDAFWFLLLPVGLSAVTMPRRSHAVLTAIALLSYLVITPFGPGLPPATTGSRVVSIALFGLAMSLLSGRLKVALTEAEVARAALADHIDDLAAANTRLTTLDRAKDEFVSAVSHELRTPLTVIVGMTDVLDSRWEVLEEERRRELARRVGINAQGLQGIVATLLDLARIERGGLAPEVEPVQLDTAVDRALVRVGPLLEEHHVEVAVADGLAVRTDSRLLERVLDNLLSNAARHTPVGSAVTVHAVRDGDGDTDGVVVTVADDGPGMAPEDVARLGEWFYRGSTTGTLSNRDGLGIGLALVRDVLTALGTRLDVASREGAGTSFSFRLPSA